MIGTDEECRAFVTGGDRFHRMTIVPSRMVSGRLRGTAHNS